LQFELRLLSSARAVGALIRAAYKVTGNREIAHRVGWQVAGQIAVVANLRRVDEDEPGWSLARSPTRAAKRPYSALSIC
jgi:hypothetical protein